MTENIQKTSPRDFFLHVIAIITLYVSAVSFTTLLFQYINYFFRDPLFEGWLVREAIAGPMRWSVASLIIIFPVFALVSRFLTNAYTKTPYLRNLRIRRWLIYFTLFAASLIIIGDLVTLIFRLLGGEISTRFVLKVVALFFVTGSIFGYYLWDLREEKRFNIKPYIVALVGIIGIAIVGAFFIVGTPQEARLFRADQERVAHLQNIQWEIVNYWQTKESLPASLPELNDSIRGFVAPRDPETSAEYAYRTTGEHSFELCATFSRPSESAQESLRYERIKPNFAEPAAPSGGIGIDDNWAHGAGEICFQRTIDPDRYPPIRKR